MPDHILSLPSPHYLFILKKYLQSQKTAELSYIKEKVKKRASGESFSFNEHLQGLIYALLSNQAVWKKIHEHLFEINDIFFKYDKEKILLTPPSVFCEKIKGIKCGNRAIHAQMRSLRTHIHVFERIEAEYGSLDDFVTSEKASHIVTMLSSPLSPYKLPMVGKALAWEYLRNVGIDAAKPDVHVRRFLGADRMGNNVGSSPASLADVEQKMEQLAQETGLLKVEIDDLIWRFCAKGYGEICTASPACERCVIAARCHTPRHGRDTNIPGISSSSKR